MTPSLPVWKLLRNRYGRAVYDALGRLGVTFSRMYCYVADRSGSSPAKSPAGVSFDVRAPDEITPPPSQDEGPLAPDDDVVVALADGRVVGYQTLSTNRAVRVPPVGREVDREAFLWGLYVEPDHRNRGVATALVGRALGLARERGAERTHSLVAVDNLPSQSALESNGFEARRVISYCRLFGLEWRRSAAI